MRLNVVGSLEGIRKIELRALSALSERAQTIPYGISVNPKKTSLWTREKICIHHSKVYKTNID